MQIKFDAFEFFSLKWELSWNFELKDYRWIFECQNSCSYYHFYIDYRLKSKI